MKKNHQCKTALLALFLSSYYGISASAAISAPTAAEVIQPVTANIIGSIDCFNENQIHGWAYDTANTCRADEIQIKITNSSTGEVVEEITADPNASRSDLTEAFGHDAAPVFTVPVDLSRLPDGVYSAAGYTDGRKITSDVYYLKSDAEPEAETPLRSLGRFRLTAYCPCSSCSEGWGRRTSSGAIATANHTVAADRRVLPAGSRVMINGTVYTVEDVGGGVRGNHIDIFFDSHAQALQFGSSSAEVFLMP